MNIRLLQANVLVTLTAFSYFTITGGDLITVLSFFTASASAAFVYHDITHRSMMAQLSVQEVLLKLDTQGWRNRRVIVRCPLFTKVVDVTVEVNAA